MASIPLVALSSQQPQQPDPLGNLRGILAMKSAINQQKIQDVELQQKQQAQTDLQARTAAIKDWDGQDYGALSKSVIKNGGSADAALAIEKHGLDIRKQVSDIASQDATTGSKNLETFIGKHKAIGDALEGIEQVPDEQLHQTALSKIADLTTGGIIDPQHAQMLSQKVQSISDPKQLRQLIDMEAKDSMGAKAVAEQAKTKAETAKDLAQGDEATQAAEVSKQKALWYKQHPELGAPGVPAEDVSAADWLAKNPGKTFSDYTIAMKKVVPAYNFNLQNSGAAVDAGGQPSAIAQAIASNKMKWSEAVSMRTPQAVKDAILKQVYKLNPDFDTSEFGLEQDAAKKARSGAWADTRLAYNTALDHSDLLLKASDALGNNDFRALNSLANNFKTAFGWSGKINYDAISNAYNHEVNSVISKGHITDKEVETGHATLPDNANAQTIRDVVGSYKSLMSSKRDELDKIIKAGAGNKANAVINTGSSSDSSGGGGKKVLSPAEWVKQQSQQKP